ncbi:hypothetical protein MBLNU230_g1419t1 [Neophaeotheca triangularis]
MAVSWRSLAVLFLPVASCVNVTFYDGNNCSGYRLYGGSIDKALPCYDLSDYAVSNSSSLENLAPGQVVHFYSDAACENEVYKAEQEVCHVHTRFDVASFKIAMSEPTGPEADGRIAVTTTDLAVYKMDTYEGEGTVAPVVRIPLSTYFFAYYGLEVLTGAVTLYSVASTCYGARFGDPKSIFDCIVSPVSTVLAYFLGKRLQNNIQVQTRGRLDAAQGTVTNVKRGLLEEAADHEYLTAFLNGTDTTPRHVGYTTHDLGNGEQTSPVYEFANLGTGEPMHMAAFWHAGSESYVHRMYHPHAAEAEEAAKDELSKRQGPGYLSLRYNSGGLEFQACNYNTAADRSVFQGLGINDHYSKIYEDLTCLFDPTSYQDDAGFYFDVYNGQRNVVSGIKIRAFDDNRGGIANLNCDFPTSQNQQCLN